MNNKYDSIICNLNTSIKKNLCVTFNSCFLDQTDSVDISSGGVVVKGGLGISKNVNIGKFLTVVSNSNILGNLNVTNNINVLSGCVHIGNLGLESGVITDTSGSISFGDENLFTTGNIGIGTTNAVDELHIDNGSANRINIRGTGSVRSYISGSNSNNSSGDSYPWLASVNDYIATANYGWLWHNRSTEGDLTLSKRNNTTTDTLVMYFDRQTGNIGIGTNDTTQKMVVDGIIKTSSGSMIGNLILADGSIIDSGNAITLGGNITISGNGIISTDLHVANEAFIGDLTFSSGSITTTGGTITFNNENLITTGSLTAGVATLNTGSTVGTLTLADGSITDSGGSISLNGNISVSGNLRFDNTNSNSPLIEVGNNTTYAYGINIGGFDTSTKADRAVIQTSNNLHLDASAGNIVYLQYYNQGKTITQNIQCKNIYGGEATEETEIHTNSSTPTYTTGSTDRNFRYRILDTGTSEGSGITIDTIPTQSTLADSTSTAYRNEQLTFRYYSGGNMLNLGSIGGDWGPSYGNEGNLVFKTCGANNGSGNSGRLMERMRINADGDVGIGTSNPQSALQVIGIKAASPSSRGIHLGEDSLDGNQSIELCADTGRFCYLDFTKINTDYRFRIITDLINETMTFHSVSNPLNFIQINNIGHLKVGQYFELGASSPNYMGILGFNRDVSSGAIFNSSYNAYQIHNFNGLLQFEAYNNSGAFIGSPINISGDYVGMGQSPNYKLDVLHTGTSSGFNTNTMSAIFQTTTGAGKHGIAIGGDVYTGNGYLQSVFNDTSTGFNILLQPIAGNVGIGDGTPTYPLHITKVPSNNNNSSTNHNFLRSGNSFNGNAGSLSANQFPVQIYCDGGSIMTNQGLYSISDRRIKTNITELDNLLDDFCKLTPVKYEFIDKAQNGVGEKWGFIAQDIKEVFPQFVKNDLETHIPSIFKLCKKVGDTFVFTEPHEIIQNTTLRFDKENGNFCMITCEKMDDYNIKIVEYCEADCEIEENEEVVCYGTKINDFHSFDETSLITICVKGIQELSVKNDNLQNDNTELNSKYNNLEVLYDNLQSKYNDLLNRVLILEGN